MNAHSRTAAASADAARRSASKDWLRALQSSSAIEQAPERTLAFVLDYVAAAHADAIALLSDQESFTFRALVERSNRYARWALAQTIEKGGVVCLLMENRAEYVAVWLGLTRVGVTVALLNANLSGAALAHCVEAANARHVVVSQRLLGACVEALAGVESAPTIVTYGEAGGDACLDRALERLSGAPLTPTERRDPSLAERALYIYTSGTTGLPKAAIVSHRRLLTWSLWFSGLIDAGPQDRMYNCLPLYHSVGGVVAVFAPLLAGGSVAIRERFSASRFWDEIAAFDCTLFQYIGELCRYLVNAPPCPKETAHRLRLAVGNGLRGDVWRAFQSRFGVPRVLEFYAATESNFSLYNVEGEPGAVGRTPPFLAYRFTTQIVKFDFEREEPMRDAEGRCVRCAVDEAGEAIARIDARGGEFEGYSSRAESEKKMLRNVFENGDAWMRSGDLMRKDARGFFYFVDRIGDTFRWKGENVATFEVGEVLAACPGVVDAIVYGVEVAGHDGRAGMAALAVDATFDLAGLRRHAEATLPPYARPLFLRVGEALETTETFKHKKRALAAQGFDPRATGHALYFAEPGGDSYARIDAALYERIVSGAIRL